MTGDENFEKDMENGVIAYLFDVLPDILSGKLV